MDLDDVDWHLLELLQEDGRLSFSELGRRVSLSGSAVTERVRRLEERGVIKGYAAVVDHTALDLPLTAFISITPLDPAAPDDIPDRLSDIPELEACHSVAGEENYILKARVRTPANLEDLLARVRATANVATRTTVVLSTAWE